MRHTTFVASVSLVVLLGACSAPFEETTRSSNNLLSIEQTDDAKLIEDQADALNRMAEQLVRRSTVGAARTGALVTCGVAVATSGNAQSCVAGAAAGGLTGAVIGNAQGQTEVQNRIELVSADSLVRSIRGMNSQMDALELGLPEVLAEQNAEFRDLELRREVGAIEPQEYNQGVTAIRDSRARIAEALTLTITQAEQAQQNLQAAEAQGQSGLDWHMSATAQIAREAHSARSMISPLGSLTGAPLPTVSAAAPLDAPAISHAPAIEAAPLEAPEQLASNVQAPRTDIVTITTVKSTKRTRKPLFGVAPRSGVLR